MKESITKRFGPYPFAHRQHKHEGHCRLLHGHNWLFDITFTLEPGNSRKDDCGFIIDFGKMDALKSTFAAMFDHTLVLSCDDPVADTLRETFGVLGLDNILLLKDVSAEGLAKTVFEYADIFIYKEHHKERGVRVARVTVWEDEKNSATYGV